MALRNLISLGITARICAIDLPAIANYRRVCWEEVVLVVIILDQEVCNTFMGVSSRHGNKENSLRGTYQMLRSASIEVPPSRQH